MIRPVRIDQDRHEDAVDSDIVPQGNELLVGQRREFEDGSVNRLFRSGFDRHGVLLMVVELSPIFWKKSSRFSGQAGGRRPGSASSCHSVRFQRRKMPLYKPGRDLA